VPLRRQTVAPPRRLPDGFFSWCRRHVCVRRIWVRSRSTVRGAGALTRARALLPIFARRHLQQRGRLKTAPAPAPRRPSPRPSVRTLLAGPPSRWRWQACRHGDEIGLFHAFILLPRLLPRFSRSCSPSCLVGMAPDPCWVVSSIAHCATRAALMVGAGAAVRAALIGLGSTSVASFDGPSSRDSARRLSALTRRALGSASSGTTRGRCARGRLGRRS